MFWSKLSLECSNFVPFFSVEVILRAEAVEQAQAGDKCDFTGTLIVVPDVSKLNFPGKPPIQWLLYTYPLVTATSLLLPLEIKILQLNMKVW